MTVAQRQRIYWIASAIAYLVAEFVADLPVPLLGVVAALLGLGLTPGWPNDKPSDTPPPAGPVNDQPPAAS
jgi:hypothetical protein